MSIKEAIDAIEEKYPWQKNTLDDYQKIKDMQVEIERVYEEVEIFFTEEKENYDLSNLLKIKMECLRADSALVLGDYEKSKAILEEVADLVKDILNNEEKSKYAICKRFYDIFGTACWMSGEFDKQQQCFQESLELSGALYRQDSIDYALALANFATALKQQGQYDQAADYLKTAIGITEKITLSKENATHFIFILNELGSVCYYQKDFLNSRKELEKAVDIGIKYLNESWFQKAVTCAYFGLTYEKLNLLEEAKELHEIVWEIDSNWYPENHPKIAGASVRLGMVLISLGEYKDAYPLLQKGLSINENNYGKEHLWVAQSLVPLADLCLKLNNIEESIDYYQRAFEIYKTIYGEDHRETITMNNSLCFARAMQEKKIEKLEEIKEEMTPVAQKKSFLGQFSLFCCYGNDKTITRPFEKSFQQDGQDTVRASLKN